MANRSYQTIKLYGLPEKIQEVLNYVVNSKLTKWPDGSPAIYEDDKFVTSLWPISLCEIKDGEILLETKWSSIGIESFSKQFPEVGFYSSSITEGYGFEDFYILDGNLIYSAYYNVEGINEWKEVVGTEINFKK